MTTGHSDRLDKGDGVTSSKFIRECDPYQALRRRFLDSQGKAGKWLEIEEPREVVARNEEAEVGLS